MRISIMIALILTLLALMACVLQTPGAEDPATSEPAEAPPAQNLVTSTSTVPTPTLRATPTMSAARTGARTIYSSAPAMILDPGANYDADFRTNYGNFRVELLSTQTPVTVNNFVFLAQQGYYDGLIFHRVIEGFMIQGGDPTGTGGGGPWHYLILEGVPGATSSSAGGVAALDEIVPGLVFDAPGKLAMANAGPGTNGSQFFITTVPTSHLNGNHTIFGVVTEGQAVVDAISRVAVGTRDVPLQQVIIERIDIIQTSRQ